MTEPRCKPGDLAVVISAKNPSNLGRIVTVVAADDGTSDLSYPQNQCAWIIRSDKPMIWVVQSRKVRRKRGPVPDAQLQPIRGTRPETDNEARSVEKITHEKAG